MIDERGPYIQTLKGGRYHLTNPSDEEISYRDIAHALSQLCRFSGQVEHFYSVAQHCVLVSEQVPARLAMDGLLHDASEAYCGDLTSPMKYALEQMGDQGFATIEELAHRAISRKFGTSWPHDPLVKEADLRALATEARDLMSPNDPGAWERLPAPIAERLWPMGPADAEAAWLARFRAVDEGRYSE